MSKVFKFYGAVKNQYKLDDFIWEAFMDNDDDYTQSSSLDEIIQVESNEAFSKEPIAEVYVTKVENKWFTGYRIIDAKDDYIWLTIGTDIVDTYETCFVFHYTPKPKALTWEDFIE